MQQINNRFSFPVKSSFTRFSGPLIIEFGQANAGWVLSGLELALRQPNNLYKNKYLQDLAEANIFSDVAKTFEFFKRQSYKN